MAFWFAAFGAGEDAQLIIMRQDNTTNEENPKEVVSFNSKVMANKKVQQILPNKFFFFLALASSSSRFRFSTSSLDSRTTHG